MSDDLVKRLRGWANADEKSIELFGQMMRDAADRIEALEQASFFADIRLAGMTAAVAESDWQPIETAPTGAGNRTLVWGAGTPWPEFAYVDHLGKWRYWGECGECSGALRFKPTHWLPLQKPGIAEGGHD